MSTIQESPQTALDTVRLTLEGISPENRGTILELARTAVSVDSGSSAHSSRQSFDAIIGQLEEAGITNEGVATAVLYRMLLDKLLSSTDQGEQEKIILAVVRTGKLITEQFAQPRKSMRRITTSSPTPTATVRAVASQPRKSKVPQQPAPAVASQPASTQVTAKPIPRKEPATVKITLSGRDAPMVQFAHQSYFTGEASILHSILRGVDDRGVVTVPATVLDSIVPTGIEFADTHAARIALVDRYRAHVLRLMGPNTLFSIEISA